MKRKAFVPLSILLLLLVQETLQARESKPGLSPRVKKAVERGLGFLAKTQEPSGCWAVIDGRCRPSDGSRVGTTSLALLSLLAQGSTPEKGKYKGNIERGLDFLLSASRKDGAILDTRGPNHLGKPANNWYVDLQTGLGIIALTETYSKTTRKGLKAKIRAKVESAVAFLEGIQLSTGGWDYRESSDGGPHGVSHGTISDTYTILPALIVARKAGFKVDSKMVERGVKSLLACANEDGSFAYTDNKRMNEDVHRRIPPLRYFRTGAVLYSLYTAGKSKTATARKAEAFLDGHQDEYLEHGRAAGDVHTSYAFMFATLGMKLRGGKKWEKWRNECWKFLPPANQDGDGSWKHTGKTEPGRRVTEDLRNQRKAYATAIATLLLQLPLGNLDLYGKPR